MGLLQRLGARLVAEPEQIRNQEVRSYCSDISQVGQIAECRSRAHCRVAGIVQSLKVIPHNHRAILEIEIFDGTDELVGVWYGRREIPGIDLGRPVVFEGTMMKAQERRAPYMINPAYHLVGTEAL